MKPQVKKDYPIGLPLHQEPKKGPFRSFIQPPPGYAFIVADVDSQETHIMMEQSKDPKLLEIYREGLDPHSVTAAAIGNCSYREVYEGNAAGDPKLSRLRGCGKVKNLSSNFRCGVGKTHEIAHVQYGLTDVSMEEVKDWDTAWRGLYRGVTDYWKMAINLAKVKGYAETLAGRRFYIDQWGKYRWASESSAIMVPIQGSGADFKYLAIAIMWAVYPEFTFWGEIHDEIIYTVPLVNANTKNGKKGLYTVCQDVKKTLDNLPFKAAWDWEPLVPFTWTVSWGFNWKDLTEV